ncbi:hypothetical protein ACSBR2_018877 [Camellia fascicularis]
MDRKLFKAAMDGHVHILKQCNQLECQSTRTNNTVLHIASLYGRSQCVEHVLSTCTALLKTVNKKGETPLHIAASKGYADIVRALIECARTQGKDMESGVGVVEEMVRMVNEEKDTALHMAARNGWVKVGELLVREDPEFEYYGNRAGESPLYLAAEGGLTELVFVILDKGSSPAHGGPMGRTALHAAVIRDDEGMTSKILEKKRFLTDIADEDGWTPLHYAAHFNHVKMVRLLLKQEKSAAYTPNKEGKTALHIAASRGHTESMQELVSECPDCCELVDGRGKNALHVAVENNEGGSVGLMLKNPLFGSLINEKDVDGNTPLHLLATWGCYIRSLIIEPRVDRSAYNAENLTALDIASCTHQFSTLKSLVRRELALAGAEGGLRKVINKDEGEKGDTAREHLKKVGETHLIVAALIATVTFTAGFTLPGGNSNNMGGFHGDANFTRQAAFKAFFVTDTVAMVLSTSAVFIYFITALYANQTKLFNRVIWAFCLTILAMGAMVLAFVTGMYATLGNPSGLAIATCVVGCCFFLVNFFVLRKLYLDKISRRSRLCGNCHGHGHGHGVV